MTNEFNTIKEQANALRKAGKNEDALLLYTKLRTEYPTQCNQWEHWGYAYCLRKLKRSEEALDVCRDLCSKHPDFEPAKSLYGWCIYDVSIRQPAEHFDEGKFFKGVNEIISVCKQETFSAYEPTIFSVVDHLKAKTNPSYEGMLQWLARLNPDLLATDERPNRDPDARQPTYPSNREKWYALRAKALLETGQFELCIQTVNDAGRILPRFHAFYDAWFYWYRAKRAIALKRPTEALADLDTMLKKNKHDFFIYHELAEGYFQLGEIEKALQLAAVAALQKGDIEFKWKLFLLMAELFESHGDQELAQRHALLALASNRESGGETLPKILAETLRRLQLSFENPPSASELRKELVPVWNKLQPQVERTSRGTLEFLHANGKSGRVRCTDSKSYFFSVRDFQGKREHLKSGLPVLFNLRNGRGRDGSPEVQAFDLIEA